jgi:hypothetical protein
MKWRKPRKYNPWKLVSWPVLKLGISRTQDQRFKRHINCSVMSVWWLQLPCFVFWEPKVFFWNENRLLRVRLRDIFSVTPSKFWDSNLKLIITRGCTTKFCMVASNRPNFRTRIAVFTSHTKMRKSSHEHGNSEDYSPLQHSGSSTWNLLHVTHFASRI